MAADDNEDQTGITSKRSPRSVADTVSRLLEMAGARGMKVFAAIDQAAEARNVGQSLRETILVIFGSPAAGTPVMVAAPLSALDLPLKVLVWEDEGRTTVSYYSPRSLAERHHLSADLASKLAGIDPLTDALVAP
jgi:uncharacterized protein (DUF302 family)